jgi:hypothetical protein
MMPGNAKSPRGQREDEGVAAIEFVIVLPVLLLLFFGMINLTNYISMMRKVNSAAELVTDLVSRHNEKVKTSDIDDYFKAAALLFLPSSADNLQIQLFNYHDDDKNGVANLRWDRSRTAGTCDPPDLTDPEIVKMLAGSDVLIAVACMPGYTAPASFPGLSPLTVPQRSVALRPRQSNQLMLE